MNQAAEVEQVIAERAGTKAGWVQQRRIQHFSRDLIKPLETIFNHCRIAEKPSTFS